MKKLFTLFIILFLYSSQSLAKEIKITTTIKPIHSLIQGVVGDKGKVQLLLKNATSPHSFHLKPSHIKNLNNSDIIFYIDHEFEAFLNNALKSLNKNVKKVALAENKKINLLKFREDGNWTHNDDHHGHGQDDKHHGEYDMHIWLSINNAILMVEHIKEELIKVYPKYKKDFVKNAKNYTKKLIKLDKKIKNKLKNTKNKGYFVFHDAYQYFEKDYNLNALGAITFKPGTSLSPKAIKDIKHKIKHLDGSCVFYEPQFSNTAIKNIFKNDIKVKIMELDPLGSNIENGEKLYFKLLKNLTRNLNKCLK